MLKSSIRGMDLVVTLVPKQAFEWVLHVPWAIFGLIQVRGTYFRQFR